MKSNALKVETSPLQIFLRIKHPTLVPLDITRALELVPEHAVAAGLEVGADGVRHLHSESYWLASLPTSTIKEMIDKITNFTTPTAGSPFGVSNWREISQLGGSIFDVAIYTWLKKFEQQRDFFARINDEQGSVTLLVQRADQPTPFCLRPAALQKLADLGIAIEVD